MRTATPQHKTDAQERRERFRALARKVSAMSDEERTAIADQLGLVTIAGHRLTNHNANLVWHQLPTASVVGGFRQWLAAGRCVAKGQHGIMIWVPCRPRKAKEGEQPETDGNVRFISGTVFDISQTVEIGGQE